LLPSERWNINGSGSGSARRFLGVNQPEKRFGLLRSVNISTEASSSNRNLTQFVSRRQNLTQDRGIRRLRGWDNLMTKGTMGFKNESPAG
jgi:hypothetical protein